MDFIVKNTRFVLAFTALFSLAVASCGKGDGEADCGLAFVYMPQATITGSSNQYPVPSGDGTHTYNFKLEGGKLNIILGVLRSGKFDNPQGFSVNIQVSSAETDNAVALIDNAVALPSNIYQMPNKVTVEDGNSSATFYLSVDVNQLLNGTYDGKQLVLAVEMGEPTHYNRAEQNTSVVVVIDVDAMRTILTPQP